MTLASQARNNLLSGVVRAARQFSTSGPLLGARILIENPACTVLMEPVNAFGMNQYLVVCNSTLEAAMIDAGDSDKLWKTEMVALEARHQQRQQSEEGEAQSSNDSTIKITKLLQTHAHIDHVLGLAAAKEAYPEAPIHLHPEELPIYENAETMGAQYGLPCRPLPSLKNEVQVLDGDTIAVGNLSFNVLFTPGHAPGHVCYQFISNNTEGKEGDENDEFMFVGDLIFEGSIGRTDLPLCDMADMEASLKRIAMDISPATQLFPGHMGPTRLSAELHSNPFVSRYA